MKQKYIIGISIFIILLVAGALFAWPKKQTSIEPITPPTATPTQPTSYQLQPTYSSSTPEGWKTYRNEEFGFEIKYPPSFKIDTFSKAIIFYTEDKIDTSKDSIDRYGSTLGFGIYEKGETCGDCSGFNLKEISINNYYAQEAVTDNSFTRSVWIYSSNRKKVFRIDYSYPSQYNQLFNKMLSTFRFLK